MACSVLGGLGKPSLTQAAFSLLLLMFLGNPASLAKSKLLCTTEDAGSAPFASQTQAEEFRQKVEAGPLYPELVRRLGAPGSCQMKLDGERIALLYSFRREGQLEAQTDPSIEYSEQSAQFPGLNNKAALAILERSEAAFWGPGGCGIDWSHSADEPAAAGKLETHATVYKGTLCNCRARILRRRKSVMGLNLSSSC